MSDFEDLLTNTGEAALMLVHGDDARFSYAAPGGSPSAYRAIVGPETGVRSQEATGEIVGYSRSVSVDVADLASVVVSGTATVDSVGYVIRAIERTSGGQWLLDLYRAAATEMTRDNYRRAR